MARRNKKKIYSIILINHGKQLHTIYSDTTEEKIYKQFEKLLKENKKVMFPIRFNNHEHVMIESEYELVIIKCRDENESLINKVRTDSGEFIDYTTTDDDWIVIDRAPYNIEETFWVYGYHPRIQRKDFKWIFDNFISADAKNKYMFKTVQIYKNKLLVDCNGKLEMVICKNKQDGIRLYNKVEEESKRNKFKYIIFMGDVSKSKYRSDWIKKIKELTHWSDEKVKRGSTRP
jgi:hypothetical protein